MDQFKVPAKINKILTVFIGIGILSGGLGFLIDSHVAWPSFLVFLFFLMALSLSGTFFASLQMISGAKWSVVVRRVAENTVSVVPVVGLLVIVLFFGIHHLYEWSHAEVVAKDHILQSKAAYLNTPFFIGRLIAYVVLWFGVGYYLRKTSIVQDTTKNPEYRTKLVKISAVYVLIFAYTFTFASIDMIMSLQPHWYTTMYPVYTFSGLALSGIAALIILVVTIQKNGGLKEVNAEHMHDLGKFLFMFTVFWAYIAFSQHMLTWYANLPEETYFLETRTSDSFWKIFTAFLWIMHFLVPFIILLSRDIKRDGNRLIKVAWLILFMCYVDVIWMVFGGLEPNQDGHILRPNLWMDFGLFLGAVGIFGLMVLRSYSKAAQIPIGDPKLQESIEFHQTH